MPRIFVLAAANTTHDTRSRLMGMAGIWAVWPVLALIPRASHAIVLHVYRSHLIRVYTVRQVERDTSNAQTLSECLHVRKCGAGADRCGAVRTRRGDMALLVAKGFRRG